MSVVKVKYSLNHPIYNVPLRVSGFNCRVKAESNHTSAAAKVLRRLINLPAVEHSVISTYHRQRAARLNAVWLWVVKRAFQKTFGRPYELKDYKISGIIK